MVVLTFVYQETIKCYFFYFAHLHWLNTILKKTTFHLKIENNILKLVFIFVEQYFDTILKSQFSMSTKIGQEI